MARDKGSSYRLPYYRRQPLRFECTGCGACCSGGDDLYVFLDEAEARRICSYLGLSWGWFRRRYLAHHPDGDLVLSMEDDGDCVFLGDGGRCRIYPVRPVQCATYPFWPEVVTTAKGWRREAARCEGMGRGAVIPLAEIEARLAEDG